MRLPHPLRISEGGNLCGLHRAGFLSVCVTLDAPRTKSKSQEVESIVSHPLKFAEGGAASVGLMEGWASPQARIDQPFCGKGAVCLRLSVRVWSRRIPTNWHPIAGASRFRQRENAPSSCRLFEECKFCSPRQNLLT